jgi:hypothetical protein
MLTDRTAVGSVRFRMVSTVWDTFPVINLLRRKIYLDGAECTARSDIISTRVGIRGEW